VLAAGALPGSDRWATVLAQPGQDLPAELDRAARPSSMRVLLVIDRLPHEIAAFLDASRQRQRAGIRRARRLNTFLAKIPGRSLMVGDHDDQRLRRPPACQR
jgi:hypothetical protein